MNPFLVLKILAQKNIMKVDALQNMHLPGISAVIFMGFIEEINI